MKAEDLALFDAPAEGNAKADDWGDDWGEPAAKPGLVKDESTGPDGAEGIAARDAAKKADAEAAQKRAAELLGVSAEAVKPGNEAQFAAERAQVVPDDAPKNDADAPPPAKASKGKGKAKAASQPEGLTASAPAASRGPTVVVELGPESRALLEQIRQLLAKAGTEG